MATTSAKRVPRIRRVADFSKSTIDFLRDQVGNQCSLCDRPTSGPSREPSKRTNVGTAAHIAAASPGGPRYDASLTANQRRHHENGIWCCRDCGKVVDDDAYTYDVASLRHLKSTAIERARQRVISGEPPASNLRAPVLTADDLCIRWDEELAAMGAFVDRALKHPTVARELDGWDTPFWTTRRRDLMKHFGRCEWWVESARLYEHWRVARRGFPTLERVARPTMTTGFRMEQAARSLRAANRSIVQVRRCLAVERQLAAITERDRHDAIRICLDGAKSASGTYHGFASDLGIATDSIAHRLAVAAWNFSCDAPSREQDARAAALLRSGWIPSAEVMMIEGAGRSRAFQRLLQRRRPAASS
jgi:hypothetical protein